MPKFTNIKPDDKIYSIVFGLGKVIFVLTKPLRLAGYYIFEVEYKNGQKVHYTEDGKPNWCKDMHNCSKTICYKYEVDFDAISTKSKKKILSKNKINKLRSMGSLEIMSPAGGWINSNLMPDIMVDNAINNKEYKLFRKIKKKLYSSRA